MFLCLQEQRVSSLESNMKRIITTAAIPTIESRPPPSFEISPRARQIFLPWRDFFATKNEVALAGSNNPDFPNSCSTVGISVTVEQSAEFGRISLVA